MLYCCPVRDNIVIRSQRQLYPLLSTMQIKCEIELRQRVYSMRGRVDICIFEQGKVGQWISLVGMSWRLVSAANIFASDSGAFHTMRSREQTCADDDRRYAPQYIHDPATLSDVLKERCGRLGVEIPAQHDSLPNVV